MTRVALDLLGGDRAPEQVVDGALLSADEQGGVDVGPPELAERLLVERGAPGRLEVVAASQVVAMQEDPSRGVRAKRDATIRVACRLVRDGAADAVVSVGSTGAALAAAVSTLGRLRAMSRPALGLVVPAQAGPLVLLDAGATVEATPELLGQFALVGAAFASVRLGLPRPRVGLLTNGPQPGKGDQLRKDAFAVASALPVDVIGNVEGCDVPVGGRADVVVTDGFTGNVLVKGLEGAAAMLSDVRREALLASPERRAAATPLLPALSAATARLQPDVLGGGMLLGVNGVVVVGHGGSSPRAVAARIGVAVRAARERLVSRLAAALDELAGPRPVAP
ncbi:MAG: phosphate:acyl-(acyl carrier protein) acyltransferase [Frankiales bacterium]|nr:phosphate:acyl-(acyl carrier protein) acyltransferase [Frankiales bacterium]